MGIIQLIFTLLTFGYIFYGYWCVSVPSMPEVSIGYPGAQVISGCEPLAMGAGK